jgi:hypothetical protein
MELLSMISTLIVTAETLFTEKAGNDDPSALTIGSGPDAGPDPDSGSGFSTEVVLSSIVLLENLLRRGGHVGCIFCIF